MTIQIDQSGKIEETNRPTVIGFSNHICKSLIISAQDKKELQFIYRGLNEPRKFIPKTFAILIYLLIQDRLASIEHIVIDREYPGHEQAIKQHLTNLCQNYRGEFRPTISFQEIGKNSDAHAIVHSAYISRHAELIVSLRDVIEILIK